MRMQTAAQNAVSQHVYPQEGVIGATALIEPGTGKVKALAQSRALGKEPGETFLNYTVPKEYGKANGFQPGSTFKTFVLAGRDRPGHPAEHDHTTCRPRHSSRRTSSRPATGSYQSSNICECLELRLRSRTTSTSTPAPRAR